MRSLGLASLSLAVSFAAGGCAADVVVADVSEVDALTTPGVRGRDGGASVKVGDRSLWIFGDSFLPDADPDGFTLRSNTWFSTADVDASDGVSPIDEPLEDSGAPRFFLEPTADERAFNLENTPARIAVWPGTSVVDGDTVLTFFGLIGASPGEGNFEGTGGGVATWSALDAGLATPPVRHALFDADVPGTSAAAIDDGFVYIFLCDGQQFGACRLARAPVADATDSDAWTFWDGRGFQSALAGARTVVDGAPIMTLFRHGDLWALVYSAPFSNDVMMRTAERIEGPWSGPAKLFTADHGDDTVAYDAYVHPELTDSPNEIVVSYTRNTAPFASETVVVVVTLE